LRSPASDETVILLLPRLGVVSIVPAFRVDLSSTMPSHTRELLTYRDYRVVLGFEFMGPLEQLSSVELGYAFSRQVRFTEAATTESFPAAFVLQWVGHY
jgi:hypothetical protein